MEGEGGAALYLVKYRCILRSPCTRTVLFCVHTDFHKQERSRLRGMNSTRLYRTIVVSSRFLAHSTPSGLAASGWPGELGPGEVKP